jgi:hypothetical protein
VISKATLGQNIPNPSNANGTEISYQLPSEVREATLVVRNYLGVEVHRQTLATSENSVSLQTSKWANGLYTYSLVVDGRLVKTLKMVVGQ